MSTKKMQLAFAVLRILAAIALVLQVAGIAYAKVWTEPTDYPPGSTVWIQGDNSDGAAYVLGEPVHVEVTGPLGGDGIPYQASCDAKVEEPDPANKPGYLYWTCPVTLWDSTYAAGTYNYTAYGSQVTEQGTFTDAQGSFSKPYAHWSDEPLPGDWNNNILNANKSNYFEGEVIPHVFMYGASNNAQLVNGQSYSFNVTYNYYQQNTNAGGFAYMTQYNLSRQPNVFNWATPAITPSEDNSFTNGGGMHSGSFFTVDADITDVSAVTYLGSGSKDGYVTIKFTYTGQTTGNGYAAIYYGLFIANPGQVPDQGAGTTKGASAWTGGSLQTTVDIGGSGATSIQLSPAAIIAGQISGFKWSDLNGNGSFDSNEPKLSGWTIQLCADSACGTILQTTTTDASGNYTFSVIPGTYYVREVLQSGWKQTAPASNIYGPLTINATTPTSTNNNFGNQQLGTIIVKKYTTGGDAKFSYTTTGGDGFPASFDITTSGGSGSQTYNNIVPGAYTVAETPLAGWTLTSSSCDSGTPGSFTVPAGGTVTCTFNNTRTYNKDLTVSKTATASFGRLYKWLIDKSVDKTTINIADGGTATFNYSVKVTPNGYTDSAWAVAGKITVSNPNGFPISGVNVTDAIDNGGACTVTGGTNLTIPANGNVVLDYSCTYAAAPSPAAGTNTAKATWNKTTYDTPNDSASGTAGVDFSTVTPSETNKTITVVDDKTDPANPVTLGTWNWADGEHTFTYSLDKKGVAGTCKDYTNTAKINETGQSDSQKVTVCVGKDLTVSKTAAGTYNRAYQWKISKDVDQTLVKIADGGSYTFHYTVVAEQTGVSDAGWTLSGKITLTNPNDWEDITLTTLSDAVDNGGICTVDPGPYVVPKSGSLDVNYSCSYASAPSSYSGTNTATATWNAATYYTPSGSAFGSAPFTLSQLGSTNKTVHVTDTYGGALGTVTATDAAPYAKGTFTYDRTESGVAGKCTSYDNTAKITETGATADKSVTLCVGKDLTVSKTAAGTYDRAYLWKISKDVDKTSVNIADGGSYTFHYTVNVEQTGISDAGWTLSGKITLTNPNDWEDITLTSLSDAVDNGGACTVAAGPYVVPKGGSLDVNYSCSYASAPSSYSGTNTATATWDKDAYFTPSGSANGSAPFTLSQLGSANKTVHVTDSYGGNLGTVTATDIAPFAKGTFTYDRTESGVAGTCTKYDNTATITETGQSADKSVTLCVAKDLTVSKTAAGTFGRTYLWQISKDVDQTLVKIAEGGSYTFHYTVDVEQTGISDAGWTLSGKITLTNPNDWEDITLTGLTDAVDNGGLCTVDPGPYVVPKSGSLDVNYSCSYASAPSSYSGTNTATADWDKAAAFTPTGSATGTAPFTLTQLGSTNKTVHVTDSYGGDLGTVTATDAAPFAKGTFTYDRTVSGVAGKCTSYDNTATITETDQSASKEVTLCVAKDLTVSKTASGTFDRTYLWKISKDVDKTLVKIAEGGSYTFQYTVNVEQTGISDAGWTLSGKITLTNPNDWEAIMLTGLTDVVDNGGTCTVDPTLPLVPKGGSVDVNYSCTWATQPSSYSGTNTATATWDKALAFTPTGSATGNAAFTLSQLGSTNKTVHVTDSYGGDLGTVTATDAAPYAKGTFTYDRTESGKAGTCTKYDNTAKITETGQSADKTVTLCVGANLRVSKTAIGTFDRTYLWKISKDVDKTSVNIADGGSYIFHYTVVAEQTGISDAGWTLSGKITVSNPNDWEAITVDVTDAVDNGGTCVVTDGTGVSIPASGSKTFDYTCSYASAPSSYNGTNTATATWDQAAAFTPNGSASGDSTFTLSKLGSTNMTIHVTDSYGGALGTVTATDSAPYASKTFTYSRTESGVAGTCTSYDNTAKITETNQTASKTVTLCVGKDLTVSKTASGTFDRTYLWKISKDVDKTSVNIADGSSYTFHYTVNVEQTGISDSGWTLSGKITINNPNDWEDITLTGLTDVANGGTCTVDPGPYKVLAGKSLDVNYSCTWTSKPSSYSGTNTATAKWDKAAAFTPTDSASGSAPYTLTQLGSTNKTVHVTDTYGGDLGTVTATDAAPFGKGTFTYDRTESGVAGTCTNYNNTAKITETGQSADKSVKLCVGKDLTVTKTATPTFTRTYLWSISKSVDKTHVTQVSGNVTFNYTVQVNQTGFTDSAWKVTGKITIANPNDWEDITLTSLTDAVDNGGTCTVDPGPYKVLAGKSLDVNYTCTWASAPTNVNGINTATVTWNKTTYFTPKDSASNTANFSFTTPTTTINKTITVTDTFNGGSPVNIGTIPGVQPTTSTVTAKDTTPYASQTWTYSRSIAVPDAACKSYTNTAKIVETGQSASQTVTVCKPSLVTDTMLCSLTNNQFKLVYTPDQSPSNGWKLNASNPGQFYYNMFYSGLGNTDIVVTLPYPWVTQGAVPIHVYSNVGTYTNSSGQTCLTPSGELANPAQTIVTMATYDQPYPPPSYDFTKKTTVTIHVPAVSGGFAYINIHLDYGLKGTTGYAKGGLSGNDAVKVGTSTVLIKDQLTYAFSDTTDGTFPITSINSFKKDPGIGGLVLKRTTDGSQGDPIKNAKVQIYDSSNKLLATVYTDEDGWYMWQYKWTGKAATFYVKMWPYSPYTSGLQTQTVTLKANGYLVVSFTAP